MATNDENSLQLEKSVLSTQKSVELSTWREAVDHEINILGGAQSTRIDQPCEDVTIYVIDTLVPCDVTFHQEGPATFSLSVFLDGRGTLSLDGAQPLSIEPGMAALFASNRRSCGKNSVRGGQRLHVVDLRFDPRFLLRAGGSALARLGGDLLTEHSLPKQEASLVGFRAPSALLQAAWDIVNCKLESTLSRRLYLYSRAVESLSIVATSLPDALAQSNAVRSQDRHKLDRARQIIESQYDIDWTIPRLSREVGLNERKLKEGFRHMVGNSVHAYLRKVRLDAAASLLQEGRTVTETALAVGFDNLSHFSKIFRAAKGVSPSQYARRL